MYFIKAQEYRYEWWRFIPTLLITFGFYFISAYILMSIVVAFNIANGIPMDPETFRNTADPEALGMSQNMSLVVFLAPSVIAFFTLWLTIMKFHRVPSGNIASAYGRIRWGRLFSSALIWLILLMLAELLMYSLAPDNYQYNFNRTEFIPLLILAVLLIPFQASFEELLFRGYLMQGTGLLFRSRIVAVILTSVAFGVAHALNPEVKEFGYLATMPYYISFGLFTGLIVILDNGIEIACGIHMINNLYGSVLVTYESSVLKTPALWTLRKVDPWMMTPAFLVMAVIFLLIMRRKYAWKEWKKIFRRIPRLSEMDTTGK